jgi:putative phage-type endonuclease
MNASPSIVSEPTPKVGSPEWENERLTGIGGSEIAAFAGLSPYKTPDEVWLEKTGQIAPADLSDNQAVEWGRRLENAIAEAYCDRHGVRVHRVNRTLRRKDKPWMMAHLDRKILNGPGFLEVKSFGLHRLTTGEWGPDGSTQIASDVALQLGWYFAVTGYAVADLAVLFGGQDLRIYPIERDDELVAQLEELGQRAWGWVVNRERPPIMSLEDARRRYKVSSDRATIATEPIYALDAQIRMNAEAAKGLAETIELQTAQLMDFMGDADTLLAPDGKTRLRTWKSQDRTAVDVTLLREKYPDIAAECERTSSTRVFREVKLK